LNIAADIFISISCDLKDQVKEINEFNEDTEVRGILLSRNKMVCVLDLLKSNGFVGDKINVTIQLDLFTFFEKSS